MLGRDLTKMKFDKSPNYHKVKNLLYMQYGDLKWRDEMETLDELIFTVLTQNTSDINAEKAFKNLKSRYINWDEIAKSTDEKLERIIQMTAPHFEILKNEIKILTDIIDKGFY